MVTVKIRLVRDPTLSARFIEWWTWGRWSHVEFVTDNGYLGARFKGGVKLRPFDYIRPLEQSIRSVIMQEAQAVELWKFVNAQIGKPYDLWALLGFGVHSNVSDSPREWFCSELVTAAFEVAGVPILETSHAYRISPRDVGLSTVLK